MFLIVLEKIFFVGVEKKFGYSFDIESSNLLIYEVFGAFPALYMLLHKLGSYRSPESHFSPKCLTKKNTLI